MFKWLIEPAPRISDAKAIFVAAFIILWMLDIWLTVVGITKHGTQLEYNPWMRWLLEKDHIWFVAVKMGVLYYILFLAERIRMWVFMLLSIIMVPVVLSWCLILFW